LYYKIDYLFTVGEQVFIPPPNVKSAVIRLTRYRTDIDGIQYKRIKFVVKTAFNQRRKTMRNSLKGILPPDTDTSHIYFTKRPEQLSPEQFIELTRLIFK